MAYLVYVFVISHLGHGRTQKALSKIQNYWFLFSSDFIMAVIWLLYGLPSVNVFGLLVWYEGFDIPTGFS